MTATHCLRPDRHHPHTERQAWGWGIRYFECDGEPIVEGGAEQAERCEDCDARLLPDNRAVTCWVHRLCVECEGCRVDSCPTCEYEQGKWEVCS